EPDGVAGPHADPVRDWPVLPHLLGEILLDPEGLVGRLRIIQTALVRMDKACDN
ncbi:hypothetical protein SESBI_51081, partial [Sesbania bispinosa]